MNSVITGRVVPSAVNVDESRFAIWERQVAVGAVYQAARSLPFEVIDHVGKCFALEEGVIDGQRAGARDAGIRFRLHFVMAGLLPAGKIRRPKNPLAPCVYWSGWLQVCMENCLSGIRVDA